MKKKAIIISMIAGIFILGLCLKSADGNRDVLGAENVSMKTSTVFEGSDKRREWELAAAIKVEIVLKRPKEQDRIAVPECIDVIEPAVERDGEAGILRYDWGSDCVRVDADTLLVVSDCYFPEENLQQKIFFIAEAPNFFPREVYRQDSKIWDKQLKSGPDSLEGRILRPYPVDGGYLYEMNGKLYFLDKDFKEAVLLYDLPKLMGELYSFSPGTYRTCDVTEDASRMLVCTDEGLLEYNLESGERKLLEPAYIAPQALNEEDCLCGQSDFSFAGPVKAEYAPDGQSYAFLTGTEEAVWGDFTGIVLRSGNGENLYQKDADWLYDFKWVEAGDTVYLAVFYTKYEGNNIADTAWLMDRVDVGTGEVVTFEVPKEIYWGGVPCCVVGFLDEDTLIYPNYDKAEEEGKRKNVFEIYHLSSGERQDLEVVGEADWEMMVLDIDGYDTCVIRYPK